MGNTKKIDEELNQAPQIPGAVDSSVVNKASQGVTAAKGALNSMNYDNFKQGSMYAGLQKSYAQQGQQAMKDTIGQVAARTGGMASSYATTAANQAYNSYMQTLEDAARAMYNDEYSRARDKVALAQDAYDRAYGEYRDRVGDSWTKYDAERGAYESDRGYNYQLGRDKVADDRYDAEWEYKTGQEAKDQAQADVMAIWATGGTPTVEQLQAAGWYDDTLTNEDGTKGGVSALGDAYYKQATSEPETEFQGVSAEDFEKYLGYFGEVKTQKDAAAATEMIIAATGNEDFAYALYEMWENHNLNVNNLVPIEGSPQIDYFGRILNFRK